MTLDAMPWPVRNVSRPPELPAIDFFDARFNADTPALGPISRVPS
jgi:hypothetical protein